MPKTGYILVDLGNLDTLGLFANLNRYMKSKWDEHCFGTKLTSQTSIPMKTIRLKPQQGLSN